jgi:tetratricopeptide (TPR) repeat protein
MLYDVLVRTTDDLTRSRVAAALARCWAYAGQAERGQPFADEALTLARRAADPAQVADALDAALAVRWGPDDLDRRRALARELDEVAAHVTDPDKRLQAHLWQLHVACETLDLHAMNRQIRALEVLGEQSPRALFFATTRRCMLDMLRGRPDTVAGLLAVAQEAATQVVIPDDWALYAVNTAYSAMMLGDQGSVAAMAAGAEDFAVSEGVVVVHAEAAFMWVAAGQPDRAAALLHTFRGGVLAELPRDVDWMLTLQAVLEVALALDDRELIAEAADLLHPYAGRAVVNAGAVMFHGTTDDTLSRALLVLGRAEEAAEHRAAALRTYERIGARWWRERLEGSADPGVPPPSSGVHLHPSSGGLWLIGRDAVPVAGLRGLGYLRALVGRPGQPVAALDLVGAGGAVVEESGTGELADRQALTAYRERLADLDAELAEAEDWADAGRLEAARAEKDALLEELGRVSGLGGRARTSGSSGERARVAVKKAITTAIARIETVDEPLARHLRRTVQTGLACVYEPDPDQPQDWVLD